MGFSSARGWDKPPVRAACCLMCCIVKKHQQGAGYSAAALPTKFAIAQGGVGWWASALLVVGISRPLGRLAV